MSTSLTKKCCWVRWLSRNSKTIIGCQDQVSRNECTKRIGLVDTGVLTHWQVKGICIPTQVLGELGVAARFSFWVPGWKGHNQWCCWDTAPSCSNHRRCIAMATLALSQSKSGGQGHVQDWSLATAVRVQIRKSRRTGRTWKQEVCSSGWNKFKWYKLTASGLF